MSGLRRTLCVWRGKSYYDDMPGKVAYGFMYHGITYADEAELPEEQDKMTVNFWRPEMKKGGIIEFFTSRAMPEKRFIKEMKRKVFGQEILPDSMNLKRRRRQVELGRRIDRLYEKNQSQVGVVQYKSFQKNGKRREEPVCPSSAFS